MHSKLQVSTLVLFLLCTFYTPQMFGQNPPISATAIVHKSRPSELHRSKTQHEIVVPFWTLEPGWNTQVEIRNNLAHGDLDVIAVLRRSDGSEVQAPPLTISSDQIKKVDLQAVAPDWNGRADSFGSLLLRYNSVSTGNVYAAALVQRVGHPISFHFDAYPVTPSFATGSHETVWWLPQPTSDGYLIVSNFSGSPVQARQVFTQGKSRYVSPLTLAPHQTVRTSIREAVQGAGFQPTQGGVKVDLDAGAGSVYVAEVLFDEIAEFSALMKVFLRDPRVPIESFTLRAPLVGLSTPDPLLGFPEGTVLHPTVLLRNATSQAIAASMVVNWRGSGKSTGTVSVHSAPLAPEETRVVDISSLQSQGLPADAHWANVEITYTGRPGDLVPLAASYDQTSRYGLQSPFSDSLSFMWKGGMWHVDAQHGTLITTGNAGQKNSRVAIKLFYGQTGVYELPVRTLAPGGQVWIDVGELIHDQVPDQQGQAMPPDTMEGSYEIKDLDNLEIGYLYEGKLVTDRTFGHATYGCAGCCAYGGIGYDGIYLEPNPSYGLVGGGDQYIAWATNVCDETDNEVTATWTSSVQAVATINTTSGYALFHSVGTSVITGTAKLQSVENPSCRPQVFQSQAPATVFDVGATGPPYIFVGTDANEIRANEYQVTNAAHTALPSPPGGTCCAASSDASDTVTLTPTGNNPYTFHVETLDQSATAGDRTLTFEYDLSGDGASVQLNVTARKFAYLTNNNPGNDCHLQYGTNRTYAYTVYTHPDGNAVVANDGLVGTAVGESFNPNLTCMTVTGNGGLQPSGQIFDNVTSGCSTAPLTCTQTSAQSLNVAGYPVRTNTLQWTSNGVIYTSNGPTQ